MTYEELLDQACVAASLPAMARIQLPSSLSEKTKMKLMKLTPEEVGQALARAIDQVNSGSVKTIDKLVLEQVSR